MRSHGNFMGWEAPGWAVITGASSGIGEEYARRLGDQGFSLLLSARRGDRLDALAESLRRTNGTATEVLTADLGRMEDIRLLADRVRSLENIDILVNNAGFATVGPFSKADLEVQMSMLNVQTVAPVILTRTALPNMIRRNRGLVILTSSLSAFMPAPGSGVYIPAKAFLTAFAGILAPELKPAGIRVQVLCPGYTRTEFHKDAAYDSLKTFLPRWVWGTSRRVVEESLRGARKGKTIVIPGLLNRLTVKLIPKRLLLRSYMKKRWAEISGFDDSRPAPDR
jgi:short-subunit dehydrogenase